MKIGFRLQKVFLTITALGFFACGPMVNTTKVTSKNLSNYETFAYLPNGNFDEIEGYNDNTVGTAVISRVNENMKDLGYELDRDEPDLLVLIGTQTDTEQTRVKEPVYATYPTYYTTNYRVGNLYEPYYYYGYADYTQLIGYDVDYDTYKEGTLMLSIVDRETKNVLWKANAYNFIAKGQNNSRAIAKYVDDIFAKYPVKK
ncbi:DUF4136 domain-containing protein [Maribacter aestuarii]|uniref:DUF4136 domain-containing protein n=1 Tax=Maribacter aestuarii TaxID=1130723 RepID=UPI00248B77AE|nr:DUF4136 domain-containing protein [Maribacter aestuarii]